MYTISVVRLLLNTTDRKQHCMGRQWYLHEVFIRSYTSN